jgi:hypothetical protein
LAVLIDNDRADIWARLMRELGELGPITIIKADIRAAVDAFDDLVDANASAFNNALPANAKAGLNASQKAFLFAMVMLKRAGR